MELGDETACQIGLRFGILGESLARILASSSYEGEGLIFMKDIRYQRVLMHYSGNKKRFDALPNYILRLK